MKVSWRPRLYFVLFISYLLGAIYSYAWHSISLGLLFLFSFLDLGLNKSGKFYFHASWELFFQFIDAYKKPAVWAISSIFLLTLLPYETCDDPIYFEQARLIKLPALLLPGMYFASPKKLKNHLTSFFEVGLIILVMQAFVTSITQQPWSDESLALLKVGKYVDLPGHHVKFSAILALTLLSNITLLVFHRDNKGYIPNYLKIGLIALLIGFQHLIAVRTGLVLLYAGIVALMMAYIIIHRKYFVGLLGLTMIMTLPIFVYNISPTFNQKVHYMLYDLQQYKSGKGAAYSDSGRLISFQAGMSIIKENPLLGVGNCNIRPVVKEEIETSYPTYPNILVPHNQLIYVGVCNGILGIISVLAVLFIPLYFNQSYKTAFGIMLFCTFFTWAMIDQIFEGTVALNLVLFFYLILMRFSTFFKKKP